MESPATSLMTIEEWADLSEDAPGELVDGRLEEDEMPTALHEAVVSWLFLTLGFWARQIGGECFASELKMRVGKNRGRKGDLAVYLPGRPLPGRSSAATRRPPSIVIEVLSPRPRDVRRDVVDKKRDYAAFDVTFYWIIDPLARTLEVFELSNDGRYSVALSASEGAHDVPGCDGLTIDLDALWAATERLPACEE